MNGRYENAYKSLVVKPEGKIPHARPRHRWEDTLKLSLKKQCGRKWVKSSDSGQENIMARVWNKFHDIFGPFLLALQQETGNRQKSTEKLHLYIYYYCIKMWFTA
jgi:hypothetical protein